MKTFERILVVRTDRIGDVILTLPMLEVLRESFPRAHIAVLVREYTRELVAENPNIDDVLLYDHDSTLVPFFRMASTIRKENFDVVFVTYPRFRLARLMVWAQVPLRVGTGYRWYSFLFNRRVYVHRKVAQKHEAEYNIDLLKAVGCAVSRAPYAHLKVPPEVVNSVRRRLPDLGITGEKPLVILHPGSGGSARSWRPANFGALGRKLAQTRDVQVAVTGGTGEEGLAREVADMIGANTPVIVDRLSLLEYAALAGMASVLVANSTGPLHIAASVGTPVVGLYPQVTPMSVVRWGPYTDRKTIFVPQGKPLDCRICLMTRSEECDCMNSILVNDVFEAAQRCLESAHVN